MSLADASRPLPAVPCPTFDGREVRWRPWETAIQPIHVPRAELCCDSCGGMRISSAMGVLRPMAGETFPGTRIKRAKRSGRTYEIATRLPAWPIVRLYASICCDCYSLHVLDTATNDPTVMILCDRCDACCAVGIDETEARSNLIRLGGASAEVDVEGQRIGDLCRGCTVLYESGQI